MSSGTMTCPHIGCGKAFKVPQAAAPGSVLGCPHRRREVTLPAEGAPATLGLAPEEAKTCPSCQAAMEPKAVFCVACGFDLRTGRKVAAAKKSSGKRPRREEPDDPFDSAEKLIELARNELYRLPHMLGLGDDSELAVPRRVTRTGRCANPNCSSGVSDVFGDRRAGTSKVTVTLRGEKVVLDLCEHCTEALLADIGARDATAQSYLREDLKRARKIDPKDPRIADAEHQIRKVGMLAGEQKPRSRMCFVATAAFATPFAEEVEALRRFRDVVLERSFLGRCCVGANFRLSPPLAALIARSDRARAAVRGLPRPVVRLCERRLAKEKQRCVPS